jgi:hypothetical protein
VRKTAGRAAGLWFTLGHIIRDIKKCSRGRDMTRLVSSQRASLTRGLDPRSMRRILAASMMFAIPLLMPAPAASQAAGEYELKAAYLYNFARFVEWPPREPQAGPFTFCILGLDPFGEVLDRTLAGMSVRERSVAVLRISTAEDAKGCHVLFVSASEGAQLSKLLTVLSTHAVLTVSDMEGFAHRGGMIEFVTERARVRFDVDLAAGQGAGLMFSSDLLRVARVVRRRAE